MREHLADKAKWQKLAGVSGLSKATSLDVQFINTSIYSLDQLESQNMYHLSQNAILLPEIRH